MNVIQLIILAVLANGGTTSNISSTSADPTAPSSYNDSTTFTSQMSWTTNMSTITSASSNDLPSNTSISTNNANITSQVPFPISTEVETTESTTSQSVSYFTTTNQTSKPTTFIPITHEPTTILSTMKKPSTAASSNNAGATGRIIAYVIGGLLFLMLIIICIVLLRKRCSNYAVQDSHWARTNPDYDDNGACAVENNDNDFTPTKRPSLTTFLSKKSNRESLLDQYNMDVQESGGIINASSSEMEEKLIASPDAQVENETGKEAPFSSETQTQSQDFPPPPSLDTQVNDNDPVTPPPATESEAPDPSPDVSPGDPDTTISFPPPPGDILDLVNDSNFPSPLPEISA
ncbi:uncharacterized protein LOC119975049 [Scyliorhinus canicula]|uniref:uncharacterized protein LOC119975049 n=1 Tax=Scyliorhinus canicula TaxID=7830 RepID=UPI0018F48B24|nr:uncharacterized protein LOC119975049 [Scyliorhinus canicula]